MQQAEALASSQYGQTTWAVQGVTCASGNLIWYEIQCTTEVHADIQMTAIVWSWKPLFNIYKLPNKDRRMDVAKWPTFWGWRTTKHTPKQKAAIAITVTVGRELKILPEKMGLHDFLGHSLIRFTFITTSLFKSGTTSHLSTVAEPITAPILSFDLTTKSCKWHDNKITEG